jgi:CRISPR-associated protein Cas5h
MEKILQFDLSGKFAHFKFPFTSPNFLKKSFTIPPRTTILGLLGAIIGLKGFQQYEDEFPEYYEKLRHIPLAITLNKIPLRKLIKYNSLNSFGNNAQKDSNEGKCNIIVQEEVLLNPEYIITLFLDDSVEEDKKILEKINEKIISSSYHIYLGKNEFFASIKNVYIFSKDKFELKNYSEVENLNSIIPIELLDTSVDYENLVYDSFSKDIDFSEKKLKTKSCEIGYFLCDEEEVNIQFEEEIELCKIQDKYYYFFTNER